MVLRNLAKWLRRSPDEQKRSSVLYCGVCESAIFDEYVGYDPRAREFYHPDDCSMEANSRLSEKREEKVPMNIGYITAAYAKQLHHGEEEHGGVSDEKLPCPWSRHDG